MKENECRFAVIYRWRLNPGMEERFISGWTRVTEALRSQRNGLGSRLHRSADGLWYAYAQWPSAEVRSLAFGQPPVDPEALADMRASTAETFPELFLEPVVDLLVQPCSRQ